MLNCVLMEIVQRKEKCGNCKTNYGFFMVICQKMLFTLAIIHLSY